MTVSQQIPVAAEPPLSIERDGPIVVLTLSRPARANALNLALIRALSESLREAEEDSTARAILILGSGANFCAGADLAELVSGGPDVIRQVMDALRGLLLRFECSRLAIVAGVHGAARAGGLELVLACDAVIATRSATFGDAHLANGLLPAGGASARLPRTVGWQRAKWLILSAASIPADRAMDWGLVIEVCDEGQLVNEARRLALACCAAESETFGRAKKLFGKLAMSSFEDALESEIVSLEEHSTSRAFHDGVSQFLNRRSVKPLKDKRDTGRASA